MESPTSSLLRRFGDSARLTDAVRAAITLLPVHLRQVSAGEVIVREGDTPHVSILVRRGTLFRHKIVGDGKRQILSFHIAGDMPDLQSLFLDKMDHNLSAAGSAEIGMIPHDALRELLVTHPFAAQLMWRETLIDAAIFREWIASTGRRRAVSRMAHLLCELMSRATAMGLADGKTYALDLTQNHFADALGLSLVHVNRSLQELRRAKLIDLTQSELRILDRPGLDKVADFDPAYLHLQEH